MERAVIDRQKTKEAEQAALVQPDSSGGLGVRSAKS